MDTVERSTSSAGSVPLIGSLDSLSSSSVVIEPPPPHRYLCGAAGPVCLPMTFLHLLAEGTPIRVSLDLGFLVALCQLFMFVFQRWPSARRRIDTLVETVCLLLALTHRFLYSLFRLLHPLWNRGGRGSIGYHVGSA